MAHIVLYPGELEAARANGQSLDHLEILDQSFHGGMRVRCRAKNTATCDGGYKPLDCISYPFFPELNDAGRLTLCKGVACPIAHQEIPAHALYVERLWKKLIETNPAVSRWINAFGNVPTDAFDPEPYV